MSEDNVWRPTQVGDSVKGTLVDVGTWKSKFKQPPDDVCPWLKVDTGAEEVTVYVSSQQLIDRLDDIHPQIGHPLGVTLASKRISKKGNEYNVYDVSGGTRQPTSSGSGFRNWGRPITEDVEPDLPVEAPAPVAVADTSDVPF